MLLCTDSRGGIVKTLVISLSTFWGTRHGGVNSFNYGLCTALVRCFPNSDFLMATLSASPDLQTELEQVKNAKLLCISAISRDPAKQRESWTPDDEAILKSHLADSYTLSDFNRILIVVHDIYTGWVGLSLKGVLQSQVQDTKLIVFRHVNFLDYQPFDAEKTTEDISAANYKQFKLLQSADFVFAVGPKLYSASRTTVQDGKLFQIVPGIPMIEYQPTSDVLCIAAIGRFDSRHDVVKQSTLVVDAYAHVMNDANRRKVRIWRDSRLVLIGAPKDELTAITSAVRSRFQAPVNLQLHPFYDSPRDIEQTIRSCGINVGVVPSLYESFGLTAAEFIGANVPIILSNRTGIFDWLEENYGGTAVGCLTRLQTDGVAPDGTPAAADVANLAQAIVDVGDALDARIKDASRLKRLLSLHTWEQIAMQIGAIMELGQALIPETVDLSAMNLARFLSEFEGKVQEKIVTRREQELKRSLSESLKLGRYRSAREAQTRLLELRPKMVAAGEVSRLFADLELRTGNYAEAIKYIDSNLALRDAMSRDAVDLVTFQYEAIRNVALRDLGQYEIAAQHGEQLVKWARHFVATSGNEAEVKSAELQLSSAIRKRVRSLAFLKLVDATRPLIDEAVSIGTKYQRQIEIGKCRFAEGEVLRHCGAYADSIDKYQGAIQIAQDEGDLDLYTWGGLCLSDAYLLAGRPDDAGSALRLAESSIALFHEGMPIEEDYIQLSRPALNWERGGAKRNGLADLVARQTRRGVLWVQAYFEALDKIGRAPFPKRF
jgi:glycosyltransferase involved in cell wall biosynthesis